METLNIFNHSNLTEEVARKSNSQVLAFIGDAVFSLYVRNFVCLNSRSKINELHKISTNFVKASGQSAFINTIILKLTENELEVYKRARNYKTTNVSKNAKISDYKKATGLEAVLGYLFMCGNMERINEILNTLKENYEI